MRSNSKGISSGVKVGTGDHILIPNIDQPHNLRVSCIPQVDRVAKPDGQEIGHGPVNEIKIVVVVKAWGVEDFCWDFVDSSLLFGLLDFGVLWNLDEGVGEESVYFFFRCVLIFVAEINV